MSQTQPAQPTDASKVSGTSACSPLRLCLDMGCRERTREKSRYFILDGFSSEFYLLFDASEDPETPESAGTIDVLIAEIGSHPFESDSKFRIASNVGTRRLVQLMFALGVSEFGEKTQRALFAV